MSDGAVFVTCTQRDDSGVSQGVLLANGGDAGAKPAAAATYSPGQGLAVGTEVFINQADVSLRAAPSSEGVVLEQLAKGTKLTITGPPEDAGGQTWWQVQDPATGNTGYVPADVLTAYLK